MDDVTKRLKEVYKEMEKPITTFAIKQAPVRLLMIEMYQLEVLLKMRQELQYISSLLEGRNGS